MKKVYIAILHQGSVRIELLFRFMEIAVNGRYITKVKPWNLKPIAHNRNSIVKDFLKSGCDYLLMIDSDIVPHFDLLTLADFDKDIISPICLAYQDGEIRPLVLREVPDGYVCYNERLNKGLVEVDACGTGCLMIKRRVLERVKAPFMRKWSEDGLQELGQDFYFCKKAKKLGFDIYIHGDLHTSHFNEIDLLEVVKMTQ